MVEVADSPSILFQGMTGSRMPIATAHGEGFANFESGLDLEKSECRPPIRRQLRKSHRTLSAKRERLTGRRHRADHTGRPLHGGDAASGARVFRTVQMSWAPEGAGEDSPWMQLFYNARKWVG